LDFRFRIHNFDEDCFKLTRNMKSRTYKPYSAPCIEVVDVVLESTVLEGSYRLLGTTGTQNLDEDDNDFVW
jgi:hypothetical protein